MKSPLTPHDAVATARREDTRALPATGAALDVRTLPSFGFGHRSLMWWGTQGLMVIESTVFALAIVTWFYLRGQAELWPPQGTPPSLLWGTVNTVLMLASLWPNHVAKVAAQRLDRPAVHRALVPCIVFELAIIVVRGFEFATLHTHWQADAYGSIVFMLLALHTTHLITDGWDTVVLAVLMRKGPIEGKRYVDVSENALYWAFVVGSWLPIYLTLYWAPRAW
jgi:heme/copper-type cytochrome/quinol oxidase subunit 3